MIFQNVIGKRNIQIICVFFATLSLASEGMQMSWSAPSRHLLLAEDSPFILDEDDIVWFELLVFLAAVLALPCIIYSSNYVGRKRMILLGSFSGLLGWIIIGVGKTKYHLYTARCFAGAANAVAFISPPMYVSEIADQNIRGSCVAAFYVMFHIGAFIMYSVGARSSLRIPPLIGVVIHILQLAILPLFPESPYYFMLKRDEETAKIALAFFHGNERVQEKLESIKKEITQPSKQSKCLDLLLTKKNRKVTLIIIFLGISQPLSGYMAILMNLNMILDQTKAHFVDPVIVTEVFTLFLIAASITSMLLVDKLGRKPLLYISCSFTTLALLLIGIFFHLQHLRFELRHISWVPAISIIVFAMFYKLGQGTIPPILCAEMCPLEMKTSGMALAEVSYNFFASISIYFFSYLTKNYGYHVVFYSFALLTTSSLIIDIFSFPETMGKSLSEIQIILEN